MYCLISIKLSLTPSPSKTKAANRLPLFVIQNDLFYCNLFDKLIFNVYNGNRKKKSQKCGYKKFLVTTHSSAKQMCRFL